MKTIPKKSFGSLKPKDDDEAPKSIDKIDVKKVTEEAFDLREFIDTAYDLAQPRPVKPSGYVPGTVRLMTVFELITDKSFPRKGPGQSTRIKILDAIIMAAIDKKLILQGAEDA